MPKLEQVAAGKVRVGDRISRTKSGTYHRVLAIVDGTTSVRLTLQEPAAWGGIGGEYNIRPGRDTKVWRET